MSQKDQQDDFKWFWTKFDQYLQRNGLRQSKMRKEIIQHFLITGEHFDAKTLHASLAASGIEVGLATVFRTLKFMYDAGLVEQSGVKGDAAHFELINPKEHHDHLVCVECNQIIEFHDNSLEKMKQKVARNHDFHLQSHSLVLYGKCKKCARLKKS